MLNMVRLSSFDLPGQDKLIVIFNIKLPTVFFSAYVVCFPAYPKRGICTLFS